MERMESGFRTIFCMGTRTDQGNVEIQKDDIAAGGDNFVDPSGGSKVWDTTKGALKTALGIAAAVIPEPFKGAAEALLKVVDVVEVWFRSLSDLLVSSR